MSWRTDTGRALAIARKDLTAERRTKANSNAVAFMGTLVLLLFGFALGPDTATVRGVASGILLLAVLFSGVLAFNRSYQLELEGGALESLLLYPGARWPLFAGKLLANLAFILLVQAIIIPVAIVLYQITIPQQWPLLLLVILAGTIGFATLGTFYAAMASRTRAREVLLPLLLFPMLVPLLVAAGEATSALLVGDPLGNAATWISLLVVFDVLFLVAAVMAFEHVIEV
jgi:heme exporter protein B